MNMLLFDAPEVRTIAIEGNQASYPVHRIFCVGRNYAAHAAEMGVEVDREAPFYFCKTPSATIQSGTHIAYPPGTDNYHFEMELVIAIGKPVFRADLETAKDAIFGYACGLDMTRRDLQLTARGKGRPWDLGKDFEESAVFSPIIEARNVPEIGPQRIQLAVNGETKQDAYLRDLIWKIDEIVSDLSNFYHLVPGDLIMTGTPAGVDAVKSGDHITGAIEEIGQIELTIGSAA